jgi:hypothetical protein
MTILLLGTGNIDGSTSLSQIAVGVLSEDLSVVPQFEVGSLNSGVALVTWLLLLESAPVQQP